MLPLYVLAIFTGAALLFAVEPMFARMVLPLLGGSPAVWNTAMVFYQAVLLAGYAYAHASTSRLGVRRQAAWHLAILLIPLAFLPIAIPAGWAPPAEDNPTPGLLAVLLLAVGVPFFAVSTTGPLLQTWFAATGHRRSRDPYFLYTASNAGSLLALVSYPVWIERHLRLAEQSRLWMWGYWALALLVGACAIGLWRTAPTSPDAPAAPSDPPSPPPPWRRRLRWVFLAFAPSSLMLGVTSYLSSDVAVVPLLWIAPLALYLATFVIAFARGGGAPRALLVRLLAVFVVALVLILDLQAVQPIGPLMAVHLAGFFIAALLCHSELAADRPAAEHLTEFYLWVSFGGALGGVFNALLAPLFFDTIAEYPVALVLCCLAAWRPSQEAGRSRSAVAGDWIGPALLGAAAAGAILLLQSGGAAATVASPRVVFGAAVLVLYLFSRRPLRFALGAAALLLAGTFYRGDHGRVLLAERSFFGVHRVALDPTGRFHQLIHGRTLHGMQSLDPARRHEPLTYYHRSGPAARVAEAFASEAGKSVGVVGLGAGSLAALAQPGQRWTYYEIDPVVVRLARDPRFFTFLRDAAAPPRIVLGDARRSLAAETTTRFDLLVLDAYSSDAIPVHLVTREALALYLSRITSGGVLAFHISNLHLDLEPVFANLARDAGCACLTCDDTVVSAGELAAGKAPSVWLVMARRAEVLAPLAGDRRWRLARGDPGQAVWTDDYSSILSVFRWR